MKTARVLIVLVGILLPYLARIPGTFLHGSDWFASYLGSGHEAFVLLGACNALCWGAVLAGLWYDRRLSLRDQLMS